MKINKIVGLMMLLGFIFLVGCEQLAVHDISEVEDVLTKFNENTDVDMTYTMNVESDETSVALNSKMVITGTADTQKIKVEVGDEFQTLRMFYVNGYLCTESEGKYTVSVLTDTEELGENPLPTDFDFSDLTYNLHTKETFSRITYTVDINDGGLKTMIEEMIGESLPDVDITMTMEITAVKQTGDLKSMKIDETVGQGDQMVSINLTATINAVGEDVELIIPNTVTKAIYDYINGGDIDPDPDPVPINYEDTADGIVKYYELGVYKKLAYDQKTDKLIVLRSNVIDIYDASTMTKETSIVSLMTPVCLDADGGKLVVGFNARQFSVIDLEQNNSMQTVQTSINVFEIVIDGDMVIYADDDQWCSIVFHNLQTNEKIVQGLIYQPLLTINRKDHILYATETHISSSKLLYFYSQTGEKIYESQFSQFQYVKNRVIFDGKFVHHEGKTFNRFNGTVVSSNYLNRRYTSFTGFTPYKTLFESDTLSFVAGSTVQNTIGIYDNLNENFVYSFPQVFGSVIELNNGKFLGLCGNNLHVAIVDAQLINGDLVGDRTEEQPVDTVDVSEDGKLRTLKSSVFTLSYTDDKYIYTLNQNSYELNVYDPVTLTKVYTTKFMMKPTCLDADSGKLVIGFGEARQFRIYDTSTWEYQTVVSDITVYSAVIYKDLIIYADLDQWCTVKSYNVTTQVHSILSFNVYHVALAINRKDGILYVGERNLSTCELFYFNLETKTTIYKSSFSRGTAITFDGNFVHYAYVTMDKMTGIRISDTDLARIYANTNDCLYMKTIFDDGTLSVFTAMVNNNYLTVVYDLTTNTALYSYNGMATNAYKVGNTIVILYNGTELIRTISLS